MLKFKRAPSLAWVHGNTEVQLILSFLVENPTCVQTPRPQFDRVGYGEFLRFAGLRCSNFHLHYPLRVHCCYC